MYFYPFMALVGFFLVALISIFNRFFSSRVCVILYCLIACFWVSNQNFNGDDMDTYLTMFGSYSFGAMTFYSNLEFSVGLITSVIKYILDVSDPKSIAFYFRIFSFALLPTISILFGKNAFQRNLIFLGNIIFLLLLPYTWLSATNIINNGFSITCFSCLFICMLVKFVLFEEPFCCFSPFSAFAFLLLFLGIFSHPYGLFVFVFLLCQFLAFRALKLLRLVSISFEAFGSFANFALFYLLLLFPLSVYGTSFLSSRIFDETILVSGVMLIFLLLLSRSILTSLFARPVFSSRQQILLAQWWKHLSGISLFALATGLAGGGDASERFIASVLGITIIFSVVVFSKASFTSSQSLVNSFYPLTPQPSNMFVLPSSVISLRTSVSSFVTIGFIAVLTILAAMNVYFYNASAFLRNHLPPS